MRPVAAGSRFPPCALPPAGCRGLACSLSRRWAEGQAFPPRPGRGLTSPLTLAVPQHGRRSHLALPRGSRGGAAGGAG